MHSFVKKLSIAIIITGILLVPFHFLIAEEQKTPIIILHGIGASVNWQQMTNKGTDSWGFVPFVNHYDQLIESLENNGYVQNQDLFIVYYDWRQSNILSATEYLEPIIYEALDNSSTDKVHIVAHSMGGLVARSYLEYSFGPKVSKFIMLGTPNYGSGDIYVLQEAGEKPDSYSTALQNIIDFYLWYLRIVDDEITDDFLSVQQHIQSAKELMPIYDYLKDSTTQEIIPYSTHSENEGTLSRNIFLEQLNETDNIQQMVDQTDEIHIIAGTNQETLYTIPIIPDDDPTTDQWTDGVPFPNPPELDSLEGDGTVPLVSARIDDPCLEPRPDPIFQAYQYIKNIIGFPTAHAQLFCGYYTEEEY
ncbi:MAG: alpha/beta hydrolase, partial [Candidatus Jacksonbacteria bacterium]|nr:alpha/beta hydrolase [Candidatus Jacksonbacteria bacterium]